MAIGFYQREEEAPHYLKPMAQTHSWKQLLRMTHLEHFHTLAREGEFFGYAPQAQLYLLFSYEERDPLTGDAGDSGDSAGSHGGVFMSTQRSGLQRLTLHYRWKE